MKNSERIFRNIGLSFDFLKNIVDNPEMLNNIKNNSVLEFVEKDFITNEKKGMKRNLKYYKLKQMFEELKK